MHLFPELHLDITKFKQRTGKKEKEERGKKYQMVNSNHLPSVHFLYSKTVQSWRTEAERRVFFDSFAASKGMNPRDSVFWSRVPVQDLCRYQPVCLLSLPLP